MDLTIKNWILAATATAFIAAITLGAGHLVIETVAATGIGTPDEITRLIARSN